MKRKVGGRKSTFNNADKNKKGQHLITQFEIEPEPEEVIKVPEDQLKLTDVEKKEEFTKSLTSADPHKSKQITRFVYKSGAFETKPNNDHLTLFFDNYGIISHEKEITVYKNRNDDWDENDDIDETTNKKEDEESKDVNEKDNADNENNDEKEFKNDEKEKPKTKLIKNQFNYSDRSSQTFNQAFRNREIMTEPAPKSVFTQNASASTIRDEYLRNLLKIKKTQKRKVKNKKDSSEEEDDDEKSVEVDENQTVLNSTAMEDACNIMERIVLLNTDEKNFNKLRYFDENGKQDTKLETLWIFKYPSFLTKYENKMVTCLCWNSYHHDLFAVGYGSFDFNKQTTGLICIYSLKANSYPERIIKLDSGVMSMDFHSKFSSLLCVGLYDGSVCVYDIKTKKECQKPIYVATNPESYHQDPIWGVKWCDNDKDNDSNTLLNFYSISSDGLIKNWVMNKNELTDTVLQKLNTKIPKNNLLTSPSSKKSKSTNQDEFDENTYLPALASCFDFNENFNHLYLIGTESGNVYQCNKTFTNAVVKEYDGHRMNIYGVKWNKFDNKTFITCSADWTIKLYDINNSNPIISYDLNCSINNICWAPYSSTIFAAVTSDSKIHVFDLSKNKNAPVISQKIKYAKNYLSLTNVQFTVGLPVIIVGDIEGNVLCLKLPKILYNEKYCSNLIDNQNEYDLFYQSEKKKLQDVLNVTGINVLDIEFYFSPKKIFASPKRIKSPKFTL